MHVNKIHIMGWQKAIEGMRFSFNSEDKTDSTYYTLHDEDGIQVLPLLGEKDFKLMKGLINSGASHRKFLRALHVQMNVKMTMSWWKQFDTYKVATTALSRSTMHTLTRKELTKEDFFFKDNDDEFIDIIIAKLNSLIEEYNHTKNKDTWFKIVDMLPMSFLQERMIDCSYETLVNVLYQREGHKLEDWDYFCNELKEKIPYLIYFYNASNKGDEYEV